jgi:hypothetical protein
MFLDMHIVHALNNGWVGYRDDVDAFAELLPGVSAGVAAEWHAALVADPPVFRAAFAPGAPEAFPLVSVELMGETVSDRYLGKSQGIIGGRRHIGFGVGQTAEITVMAKRDEVTRSLCRVIQAVMIRATVSFIKSGYISVQYDGAGELGMDEMLVAEELGIYIRRLTYSAVLEIEVPEQLPGGSVASAEWFVQLGDVPEDVGTPPATGAGTPGGVTPTED